ncbi:MAG: hypothetical protein CSA22_06835 [Deltaproteobacteria bacterium]|nr:MAG: hypothetical protein CSA22_06835 [Deltaproteobacteria bacterium]
MDACPACKAAYKGKGVCHRCKTDLKPFLRLEETAAAHAEKARRALQEAAYAEACFHAGRWTALKAAPEGVRILAVSALKTGRYDVALRACRWLSRIR